MSRRIVALAVVPLIAGCLASAPEAPTNWTIATSHSTWPAENVAPTMDDVRVSRVDVSAPYSSTRIAVLRPDGSLAFDAFNVFAISPSSLLKGAALGAVERYGRFRHVLPAGSAAKTRYALEFDVTMLALDCRTEGQQTVRVELTATLLDGRDIVAIADGVANGAAGGNYSETFSSAFFHAVDDALGKLTGK